MKAALAALLMILAGCAEARPSHSAPYAVRLEFNRGLCSGTVVARNVILTASHCLGAGVRLESIDGEPAYALEIIRDDKDHALVRVSKRFDRWAARGPAPVQGDRVSIIGNPAGEGDMYREGYVSRVTDEETRYVMPGFGGDSGAGIWDSRGRLVGVVSAVRVWQTMTGMRFEVTVGWPLAFTADDWREIRA